MKKRQQIAFSFLCLLFFLLAQVLPAAAASGVQVLVDGRLLQPDVPARIFAGRVLVPVRAVGEALGARVDWEGETKQVTLSRDALRVSAQVGVSSAWLNDVATSLDVPPFIIGGRLLVPVRFFAEGLGTTVGWDDTRQEVHITSPGYDLSENEVWGYYLGTSAAAGLELAAPYLSRVVLFSFSVDGEGNLSETYPYPQALASAKNKGIPVSVLVIQNDREALAALLNNSSSRSNFVHNIVELLNSRGYDGVNLDLESVPPEAREGYVRLVQDAAAVLRPLGKTLSLSLPAKESDAPSWQKGYDYARLGAAADQVAIMAYDQHWVGGTPGPVAALDWMERVTLFASSQIPKEKLLLGIGAFGFDWPLNERATSVTADSALELARRLGIEPKWDQASSVPYFTYTDEAGREHQVWYENMDSLTAKISLAEKNGLRGIAVWRLGFPPEGFWTQVGDAFPVQSVSK